jgi:phage-related protein
MARKFSNGFSNGFLISFNNVDIAIPFHTFTMTQGTTGVYQISTISWTGGDVPESHVEDAQKLEADAYVDLFQITLSDKSTKIYLKADNDVTWQGDLYEGTGIQLTGVASYSDGETSRPKLTIYNPEGVYSYIVDQGLLDNANIVRIRVLKEHLDADQPIDRRQQWRVSRVANLRKNAIALELRDMLDGQFFLTPGRMFIPPEFPQVSLK